jgi:hypothetical protein
VTARNALAEGVGHRAELPTGDMTDLAFDDGSFSVVTSSLAIHNFPGSEVTIRSLGPRCWFGGPWQGTSVVTATKAQRESTAVV